MLKDMEKNKTKINLCFPYAKLYYYIFNLFAKQNKLNKYLLS